MKPWILLGVGVGVAAAGAALAWQLRGLASSKAYAEVAARAAASTPRPAGSRGEEPVVDDVDALLGDGSPEAWGKLASLYPGSDQDTKGRVLQSIAQVPELPRVIGYLLATVGEDPTPAGSDPLLDEAAALLEDLWKTPEDFDYGRRMMVMQKTDKRRWLLGNALVTFARDVNENSPFYPMKGSLEANLIDLHSETGDAFIRGAMVDGVRALGGKDAALILAKGRNVADEELEALSEQKATVDNVLRQIEAR
jgi:hypothetical protein